MRMAHVELHVATTGPRRAKNNPFFSRHATARRGKAQVGLPVLRDQPAIQVGKSFATGQVGTLAGREVGVH